MGDEAEEAFRQNWPFGCADYGLRRPPIRVDMLPIKIRYTPDFLTSHGLVEVMGVGADQTLKLKLEKFLALIEWSNDAVVQLFIYDSLNKRYCVLSMTDLHLALAKHATHGAFKEGKDIYELDVNKLETEWLDTKS